MATEIPVGEDTCEIKCGSKKVTLTNLQKLFWPKLGKTKRDLLAYYAAVSSAILPHLKDRPLVMKRYPNGIEGKFFFMKRAPDYRPSWLEICSIPHRSGNVIDFPVIDDEAGLLWIVNLGCIDLNPWYSRCDDVDHPDFLHFDLDPVSPADFNAVCRAALLLKEELDRRGVSSYPKTTGSRGLHVYVPIYRKQSQKEVWTVAKRIALEMAERHPEEVTAEYRVAKRPAGRVLIDYNQNAWGRTLASVYSIRALPDATASAPLTWKEVAQCVPLSAFTIDTEPSRIEEVGDLFKPVIDKRNRFRVEDLA